MTNPDPNELTLTQHEKDVVIGVRLFASFLSFFGSLFIVFSMFFFGRMKHLPSRLIFWLAICNLVEAFGNLFSLGLYGHEKEKEGACVIQGFILQASQIAIFCWTTLIAFNLYMVVVHTKDTRAFEFWYHAIVVIISVIFSCVPFAQDAYDLAGVWCWIDRSNQVLRWSLFFIPLMVMMVVVMVLYAFIIKSIRSNSRDAGQGQSSTEKLLSKLWVYPIAFILCYVLPIINRIYDVTAADDSFGLYLLAAFSAAILGFVNAILYGFDADMKRLWKAWLYQRGYCTGWTAPTDEQVSSEGDADFTTETSQSLL